MINEIRSNLIISDSFFTTDGTNLNKQIEQNKNDIDKLQLKEPVMCPSVRVHYQ